MVNYSSAESKVEGLERQLNKSIVMRALKTSRTKTYNAGKSPLLVGIVDA